MASPELSVLVSTYQRPEHLYRCLLSLACQQGVEGCFEVVVTDDGSTDETLSVVKYFSSIANFPIKLTSHQHADFQLARCRNEGVALASAPYLLFTDGDCVFPRDHLDWHLRFRRRRTVIAGDCYRLSQTCSQLVNEDVISNGRLSSLVEKDESKRIRNKAIRALIYSYLPFPMLPRLTGNNIALWRNDFDTINGFDENFVGWGLEDRDLQRRLAMAGIRTKSILHRTAAYHLWHPTAPSFARKGIGTKNYAYFYQRTAEMRCQKGVSQRLNSTKNLLSVDEHHDALTLPTHTLPRDMATLS